MATTFSVMSALIFLGACDASQPAASITVEHSCGGYTATYEFSISQSSASIRSVGFVGGRYAAAFGADVDVEEEEGDATASKSSVRCVVGHETGDWDPNLPFSGQGETTLAVTIADDQGLRVIHQPATLVVIHPMQDACFDAGRGATCSRADD